MYLVFLIFLIWATDTEISVKKGVWGPVEWVGDQLTRWGGSYQNQNSKINAPRILIFFYLSDRYWDICKKRCLGTSWMSLKLYCWYGKHCKYVKVHCWGWTTLDREDALDNPGHTRVKQRYFCHISQRYISEWWSVSQLEASGPIDRAPPNWPNSKFQGLW